VSDMKTCVLDGARLADAAAVYRELGQAFGFPAYFGNNPDALWDALGDYAGEPVTIVWRDATRSAERLGPQYAAIVAVLKKAAAKGLLTFELG
jgi:RNAse (barnase) inhibitor barstar